MNTGVKLGTYVAALALIFGTAFGLGNLVGGDRGPDGGDAAPLASGRGDQAGHGEQSGHGGQDDHASAEPGAAAIVPAGLQSAQDGYGLTPETTTITPGEATDFRFVVTGPDGRPVTGYATRHEKKLHLIVVNRTLDEFQHLHPELTGDGVWTTRLTLPEAGDYRAFADFAPEGGKDLTLGVDLHAAGDYTPRTPAGVRRTAEVDGYTVRLDGEASVGSASKVTLRVSKDGKPVTDLEPYLGAYGHLVALRAGDLAYLHVHPDGVPGDGRTTAGPDIAFQVEVPSRGDYRLFLDFKHDGVVHTADFTLRAGDPGAWPASRDDAETEKAAKSAHENDGDDAH
ncbi:hypothetical protein AB0K60_35350 [Thermopolyspora sp. NPDC052614]|uniref:hypothetical protein n=1 Tax=Thermopolyspora sp. NPDC052614 TaxID=3155682 RepID=UPI00344A87FD